MYVDIYMYIYIYVYIYAYMYMYIYSRDGSRRGCALNPSLRRMF